jgi:hypothetical protein
MKIASRAKLATTMILTFGSLRNNIDNQIVNDHSFTAVASGQL